MMMMMTMTESMIEPVTATVTDAQTETVPDAAADDRPVRVVVLAVEVGAVAVVVVVVVIVVVVVVIVVIVVIEQAAEVGRRRIAIVVQTPVVVLVRKRHVRRARREPRSGRGPGAHAAVGDAQLSARTDLSATGMVMMMVVVVADGTVDDAVEDMVVGGPALEAHVGAQLALQRPHLVARHDADSVPARHGGPEADRVADRVAGRGVPKGDDVAVLRPTAAVVAAPRIKQLPQDAPRVGAQLRVRRVGRVLVVVPEPTTAAVAERRHDRRQRLVHVVAHAVQRVDETHELADRREPGHLLAVLDQEVGHDLEELAVAPQPPLVHGLGQARERSRERVQPGVTVAQCALLARPLVLGLEPVQQDGRVSIRALELLQVLEQLRQTLLDLMAPQVREALRVDEDVATPGDPPDDAVANVIPEPRQVFGQRVREETDGPIRRSDLNVVHPRRRTHGLVRRRVRRGKDWVGAQRRP